MNYGLQTVFPQPVPFVPPSAMTTVGVTIVLRKSTAALRTSSIRFTVLFSLVMGIDP
jgi:hypothetical protein